ncbi:MAG: hypothetical protein ACRDT1_07780 [Micromonosporaceae bacterium]
MADESSPQQDPTPAERNIKIYLSDRATLKAVRSDDGFRILVGDDVEIRGITPDHMAELVGSVMDTYLPAEMASRLLGMWTSRRGDRGRRRKPHQPAAEHEDTPRDTDPEGDQEHSAQSDEAEIRRQPHE